jgi:hypothetical protein
VDEQLRLVNDSIYRWNRQKPGRTLIGSQLGLLALGERHLIFASSGSNDVALRALKGATGGLGLASGTQRRSIELGCVDNPGSLVVALTDLEVCEVRKRGVSRYLSIAFTGPQGPVESAFMGHQTLPGWKDWEDALAPTA